MHPNSLHLRFMMILQFSKLYGLYPRAFLICGSEMDGLLMQKNL